VRGFVGVRVSDRERSQVAQAAAVMELSLSGFIRRAALENAARVLGRVKVRARVEPEPSRALDTSMADDQNGFPPTAEERSHAVVVLAEPDELAEHWVDGERVR
jgi:cytosine/adenosine deaminase-related metal-dependent hydrolase